MSKHGNAVSLLVGVCGFMSVLLVGVFIVLCGVADKLAAIISLLEAMRLAG